MNKDDRIFVAGHKGLVGSAIYRRLKAEGYTHIITRSRAELDLINQHAVEQFFSKECPAYIFITAAKVGGILANTTKPAEFIFNNLTIQTNIINAAYKYGAKKLLFLGSSCIYPKLSPQPIREEYLLTSPLEATNEWYAIAKIAGIKMCQAYRKQYGFNTICLMPTNLYGPGDNFDLENSHVLPALISKFHAAMKVGDKYITVWGTGKPRREFLYVDDLADACVFLMLNYNSEELINVGTGTDIQIADLVSLISEIIVFHGDIIYDKSKPDGTPRKLLDISRIKSLGWQAKVDLRTGIEATYKWYIDNL
jgi:GDP-L-fucose synthase